MLSVQNVGTVSIVKARAALVGECVDECRQAVEDCLRTRRNQLVLDMSDCPILSSIGLEFIVDSQQACLAQGGRFVVADPQPTCLEVLDFTGTSEYVAVFQDLRSALSDFAK